MKHFFEEISQSFIDIFTEEVKKADSIVISSHSSPDDDSISSLLGVYYHLVNNLRLDETKIKIYYTGDSTDKWQYFENFEKINFVKDLADNLKNVDLLIVTDGSGWKRFSKKEEIRTFKGKVICIDHHQTPEDKFDIHLVAKEFTSTSEIVYRLFYEKSELSKRICETILLGILGDTGNFKYLKSKDAEVFDIAKRLISVGDIDIQILKSQYQQMEEKVFKVLIEIMKNSQTLEVEGWPKFITSYITIDFIKKNSINDNEVGEGSSIFTSYLTGIKNITWGFVFTPKLLDKSGRLSLRSLPNSVCVRIMMEQMGLGGGHDRAAGGKIYTQDHNKAFKQLTDWMKTNTPTLS